MENKINFSGFRLFVEEEEKQPNESGISKFAATIKKNFNIDINDVADKVGGITLSPNIMTFKVGSKNGEDKQDGIRTYDVIKINDKTVEIKDVTGECDDEGGNKDNPSAQCSPTNGKTFLISKKDFDQLIAHVSGQGGGGGLGGGGLGGGGLGGPPMGGGGGPPM